MDESFEGGYTARSQYEVDDAVGFGVTPDDLRNWAPCYPLDIHWARANGLDAATVRTWLGAEIGVQDAVRATRAGVSLDTVLRWIEAGFAPADAAAASDAEMDLESALAWRAAGFILPDAAALYEEGWTLAAAIQARWAGIDRYADTARTERTAVREQASGEANVEW